MKADWTWGRQNLSGPHPEGDGTGTHNDVPGSHPAGCRTVLHTGVSVTRGLKEERTRMFLSCAGSQSSGRQGQPQRANRHKLKVGTEWLHLQEAGKASQAGMAAQGRVGLGRGRVEKGELLCGEESTVN